MISFPKNQLEFESFFSTEEDCQDFLWAIRLSVGFHCKKCGGKKFWKRSRMRLTCVKCRKDTLPTSGTIFHGSRVPLTIWFRACWWFTNQKQGVNALGLQRAMGIGSYRTAWMMLQKLRRATIRPGRERLHGEVEIDEFYLGGPEIKGERYRSRKRLILVAAEKRGSAIGRIRMKLIPRTSAKVLMSGILEMVEPGSRVETDAWRGYLGLSKNGYKHLRKEMPKGRPEKRQEDILPRVHRISSLFKRWIQGTFQGRVDTKHLPFYLDEYVFRFNRRTSKSRGLLFLRLLENAVITDCCTYQEITNE